jgi:NADPH:quinone reductase-like Zn-dependent oxidoreductase
MIRNPLRMKAVTQEKYGSPDEVLSLSEVQTPSPKADEVLVRVKASSVNPDVWHGIVGTPYILRLMGCGLRKPKNQIPGLDVAGTIESLGKDVSQFAIGDAVFGEIPRGAVNWGNAGGFAEYVCVAAENLAPMPSNASFAQAAAAATSGFIALHTLKMFGKIRSSHRVLVNGAGGGVGTIIVQLAKAESAFVTAVDNGQKLDMLRSLGADETVDYVREDPLARGQRYDLIVDVASNLSLADCRNLALMEKGIYLPIGHDNYGADGRIVGPAIPRAFGLALRSMFDRRIPKVRFPLPTKGEIMAQLGELMRSSTLRPYVERTYALDGVAEALRYMREGHVRGRVVIVPG